MQSGTTLVPARHDPRFGDSVDKLRAMTWSCRTAEARSFAGAAKVLDVVPSAVSKAIAALERALASRS